MNRKKEFTDGKNFKKGSKDEVPSLTNAKKLPSLVLACQMRHLFQILIFEYVVKVLMCNVFTRSEPEI